MKRLIERVRKRYFDYEITGRYFDIWHDENGARHLQKKYIKKYHLKKRR